MSERRTLISEEIHKDSIQSLYWRSAVLVDGWHAVCALATHRNMEYETKSK